MEIYKNNHFCFAGSLWVSVVLNPQCDNQDRRRYVQILESWSKLEVCPLEDPDHRSSSRRNSLVESNDIDEHDSRPILGIPTYTTFKKSSLDLLYME